MAELGGHADRPRIHEGIAWRRAFDAAAGEVRARVETAVKAGQALTDPHEAALAVGLALEKRRMATYGVVVAVAAGIILLGFGTREGSGLVIAALALVPLGAAGWAHSIRSKALKAELHNRDVVFEAISRLPQPPPPQMVSDPWEGLPPPSRPVEDDEVLRAPQEPDAGAEEHPPDHSG